MFVQVWNDSDFIGNGVICGCYLQFAHVLLVDGYYAGRVAVASHVEGDLFDTTCILR